MLGQVFMHLESQTAGVQQTESKDLGDTKELHCHNAHSILSSSQHQYLQLTSKRAETGKIYSCGHSSYYTKVFHEYLSDAKISISTHRDQGLNYDLWG
jgi:hypothetical protein